jgi:RHS repeat-associated protein
VNRLTQIATAHVLTGTLVLSQTLTLGAAGHRTRIDEHGGTSRAYTYDALYRLTGEMIAGAQPYTKSFTYDAVGNRRTQTTAGSGAPGTPTAAGTITSSYDTRDRLLPDTGARTLAYAWDANGNLTAKSGEATYAWDFDDRLIRVEKTDGTEITHAYDADGNRVRTTITPPTGPPQITDCLVDTTGPLSHVVAETTATGALQALYVRADDDLVAQLRPDATNPGAFTTRHYHADAIGSIRALTDEAGAVTDTYDYTAFGEPRSHEGDDPQPYAFAGEPYDLSVGLQYHRARWLDPATGRFAAIDSFEGRTIDPRTLHRYLYAATDPVNTTDPSGQDFVTTFTVVGGIATLAAATYVYLLPRSERPLVSGGGLRVVSLVWSNDFLLPTSRGGTSSADVVSPSEVAEVKLWTYQTMRLAYSGWAVVISEGGGTNRIVINQAYPNSAGDTRPFASTSDVNLNQLAAMARTHTPAGAPRTELLAALGRGIGATAAHEFAHQMGVDHQDHDAFSYDYDSADVPQHFYGQLHWTGSARTILERKLRY